MTWHWNLIRNGVVVVTVKFFNIPSEGEEINYRIFFPTYFSISKLMAWRQPHTYRDSTRFECKLSGVTWPVCVWGSDIFHWICVNGASVLTHFVTISPGYDHLVSGIVYCLLLSWGIRTIRVSHLLRVEWCPHSWMRRVSHRPRFKTFATRCSTNGTIRFLESACCHITTG
jgi:hypothetical protein